LAWGFPSTPQQGQINQRGKTSGGSHLIQGVSDQLLLKNRLKHLLGGKSRGKNNVEGASWKRNFQVSAWEYGKMYESMGGKPFAREPGGKLHLRGVGSGEKNPPVRGRRGDLNIFG